MIVFSNDCLLFTALRQCIGLRIVLKQSVKVPFVNAGIFARVSGYPYGKYMPALDLPECKVLAGAEVVDYNVFAGIPFDDEEIQILVYPAFFNGGKCVIGFFAVNGTDILTSLSVKLYAVSDLRLI